MKNNDSSDTENNVDQRLRLLYEAAEQIVIPDLLTKDEVIKRYKALEQGLPVEDEFVALVTWLGKCKLIHKLEQVQFPPDSKNQYQVPDFFAVFENDGIETPVLIEVKANKKSNFSWTQDYFTRCQNYAVMHNLPLLVAWKYRPEGIGWGYWCLFDSKVFLHPHKSYKMTFELASNENLMGVLVGDFLIDIKENVGLHFCIDFIGEKGDWERMRDTGSYYGQVNVYWTNGKGEKVKLEQIPPDLNSLLYCIPPVADVNLADIDSSLIYSFVLKKNCPLFAQHILLLLLIGNLDSAQTEKRWRYLIDEVHQLVSINKIRKIAEMEEDFVNMIFHQIPNTMPDFLNVNE